MQAGEMGHGGRRLAGNTPPDAGQAMPRGKAAQSLCCAPSFSLTTAQPSMSPLDFAQRVQYREHNALHGNAEGAV